MSMEIWENPERDLVNSTIEDHPTETKAEDSVPIESAEQKAEDELEKKRKELAELKIKKAELVAEKRYAEKTEKKILNKETKIIEAKIDKLEKEIEKLELERKEEVAEPEAGQPEKPEEIKTETEPAIKPTTESKPDLKAQEPTPESQETEDVKWKELEKGFSEVVDDMINSGGMTKENLENRIKELSEGKLTEGQEGYLENLSINSKNEDNRKKATGIFRPIYEKKLEELGKVKEGTREKINNALDKWGKEKEKLAIKEGENPAYRVVEFIYNPDVKENHVVLEDEKKNREKMSCDELYRLNYGKVKIMEESEAREKDEKKKWNNINRMLKDFRENEVRLRIEEGGNSGFIITDLPGDSPDYAALQNINNENDERAISRDVLYDLNPEAVEFRRAVRKEIKEAEDAVVEKILEEDGLTGGQEPAPEDQPEIDEKFNELKNYYIEKSKNIEEGYEGLSQKNKKDLLKYLKGEILDSSILESFGLDPNNEEYKKRALEIQKEIYDELVDKLENKLKPTPEGAPEVKGREELLGMTKHELNREIVMVYEWMKKTKDRETTIEEKTEIEDQKDYLDLLVKMKELSKSPEDIRKSVENLRKIEESLIAKIGKISEKDKEFAVKYNRGEELTPEKIEIAKKINDLAISRIKNKFDLMAAMEVAADWMSHEKRIMIAKETRQEAERLLIELRADLSIGELNFDRMVARKEIEPMKIVAVNRFAGAAKKGVEAGENQATPPILPQAGSQEGQKGKSGISKIWNRVFGRKELTPEQKEAEEINKKIGVEESRIKWFEDKNWKIVEELEKKEKELEEAKKSNNKKKADKINAEIEKFKAKKAADVAKNNEEIEKSKKELIRLRANENLAGAEQKEVKNGEGIVKSLNKQIEVAKDADDLQGVFDVMFFEIKLIESDEDRKKFKEMVIDKLNNKSEENLKDVIDYSNKEIEIIGQTGLGQESKNILVKFYERVIEIAERGKGGEKGEKNIVFKDGVKDFEKLNILKGLWNGLVNKNKQKKVIEEISETVIGNLTNNNISVEKIKDLKIEELLEEIDQTINALVKKSEPKVERKFKVGDKVWVKIGENNFVQRKVVAVSDVRSDIIIETDEKDEDQLSSIKELAEWQEESEKYFKNKREKEQKELDTIFSENEINKVKNAKDDEDLVKIIKNIESMLGTTYDKKFGSSSVAKYYQEFLGAILECYDNDKKKIDLDKFPKLDVEFLVSPEDFNKNADDYFTAVFEKLGVKTEKKESKEKEGGELSQKLEGIFGYLKKNNPEQFKALKDYINSGINEKGTIGEDYKDGGRFFLEMFGTGNAKLDLDFEEIKEMKSSEFFRMAKEAYERAEKESEKGSDKKLEGRAGDGEKGEGEKIVRPSKEAIESQKIQAETELKKTEQLIESKKQFVDVEIFERILKNTKLLVEKGNYEVAQNINSIIKEIFDSKNESIQQRLRKIRELGISSKPKNSFSFEADSKSSPENVLKEYNKFISKISANTGIDALIPKKFLEKIPELIKDNKLTEASFILATVKDMLEDESLKERLRKLREIGF